jgi:hypothetical protein
MKAEAEGQMKPDKYCMCFFLIIVYMLLLIVKTVFKKKAKYNKVII